MCKLRTGIVCLFAALLLLCAGSSAVATGANAPQDAGVVTDEFARDLALDAEGGVYVTGYARGGANEADCLTLKYSRDGRLVWEARYDGPAHGSDSAHALAVDIQGRVWVAGSSNGRGTSLDAVTLLYDRDGKQVHAARYDGTAGRDDYLEWLVADPAGGAVAAGNSFGAGTEHDYLVIRYDDTGRAAWTARYNPPRNRDDMVNALALGGDGSVVVAGVNRVRTSNYDWATIKYSPQGKMMWLARHSGPDNTYDASEDLAVDDEGGVYVTGYITRGDEEFNFVTIKYDREGELVWLAEYNGPAGRLDRAWGLVVDEGKNVYVTGESQGADSAMDIVTLKYDPAGKPVWERRFNGPADRADIPCGLALDSRSNLLVAGTSRSLDGGPDYILLKYDPKGELLWKFRHNSPSDGEDKAAALAVDRDDGCLITGTSAGGPDGYDVLTLKVDAEGGLVWSARYQGHGDESPPSE